MRESDWTVGARDKLSLGKLRQTQDQLMGKDVDLEAFFLQLKSKVKVSAVDRVLDAYCDRHVQSVVRRRPVLQDQAVADVGLRV